jgi:hypothetical protein
MTAKQIAGYLKAVRELLGISFNDGYNVPTYGITKAEYDAINRAMHDAYGLFPKRTPAGVREALRKFPISPAKSSTVHHATKKKTPAQLDREIAESLAKTATGDAADIADQLTQRDRSTLAWIIEDWPWPYRGYADADMARLHTLGLVEPTTGDTWGGATALGRAVWARARKTWIDEHKLGAAFRRGPRAHSTKKRKKARIVNVEAKTPAGYRWLKINARGATMTPEGFAVTDEHEWAQSLAAAGAIEIK